MLKKYTVTYSADVSIDIQSRITKKIKAEIHEIRDATEVFYMNDAIWSPKILEERLVHYIKNYAIFLLLPATIFSVYLSNTVEVKVHYMYSKCTTPTIQEVIENGTIEDLREILVEKP